MAYTCRQARNESNADGVDVEGKGGTKRIYEACVESSAIDNVYMFEVCQNWRFLVCFESNRNLTRQFAIIGTMLLSYCLLRARQNALASDRAFQPSNAARRPHLFT